VRVRVRAHSVLALGRGRISLLDTAVGVGREHVLAAGPRAAVSETGLCLCGVHRRSIPRCHHCSDCIAEASVAGVVQYAVSRYVPWTGHGARAAQQGDGLSAGLGRPRSQQHQIP
jgi:hypothetical protein